MRIEGNSFNCDNTSQFVSSVHVKKRTSHQEVKRVDAQETVHQIASLRAESARGTRMNIPKDA